MVRRNLMLVSVVVLTFSASAYGDWTYNPSTGHWYRLTAPNPSWEANEAEAVKAGGHLVAIGSAEENAWILSTFGIPDFGLAIGLQQAPGSLEPAGGWGWTNGEPLVYTNWRICCPLEPNDLNGGEDVAYMHWPNHPNAGTWYDAPSGASQGVIERELDPAVPTVSEWGIVVMTLLMLAAGTVILLRPRLAPK